jgi:FdhD protein
LSRAAHLVQAARVKDAERQSPAIASAPLRRRAARELEVDRVAREEPLEIRVGQHPLAVVMRTPGDDVELALGFLVTERVIERASDVLSVRPCAGAAGSEGEGNVVRVLLAEGVALDLERLRRNLYASSSCGICGKATIENALACAPPVESRARFAGAALCAMPPQLLAAQDAFAHTGGLHAAGLFDANAVLLAAREDVGRHNAVDKVIGFALSRGLTPLADAALLVSGRISYEIVQKALAARIPLVAGVSAPTSLAIELAARAGITLVGFLRGEQFNVYSAAERVVECDAEARLAAAPPGCR